MWRCGRIRTSSWEPTYFMNTRDTENSSRSQLRFISNTANNGKLRRIIIIQERYGFNTHQWKKKTYWELNTREIFSIFPIETYSQKFLNTLYCLNTELKINTCHMQCDVLWKSVELQRSNRVTDCKRHKFYCCQRSVRSFALNLSAYWLNVWFFSDYRNESERLKSTWFIGGSLYLPSDARITTLTQTEKVICQQRIYLPPKSEGSVCERRISSSVYISKWSFSLKMLVFVKATEVLIKATQRFLSLRAIKNLICIFNTERLKRV